MTKCICFIGAALIIVAGSVDSVRAQDYPIKPVRFVLGLAPGGSTDTVARIVAQKLSESWGQNVVVDNRPGAGGIIAADMVAKAQPDGYTIFVGGFGPNVVAGSLYLKLPYDPARDFANVTLLVTFPLALVVPASSPATGLKELIEEAKAKPGMLRYGSGGVGISSHVFLELMNRRAGISVIHVPYKGGGPLVTGVLTAEVDYAMLGISTALPQLAAGKIRVIAVTSAHATPRVPGAPPISSVLPGFEALEFHGLHAPLNTPRPVVAKLQQEVAKVLHRKEVKERFDGLAMDVVASTPEEFSAFLKKQIATWTEVVRAAHIQAD